MQLQKVPLLQCIDESAPSKTFQNLVRNVPHHHASLLMQLQMGHILLNKHLHCIGCADSLTCKGGYKCILHFLVTCPAHKPTHRKAFKKLKHCSRSLKYLLNNPEVLRPLFSFINGTKHFKPMFGSLELPPEDEQQKTQVGGILFFLCYLT